MFRYFRRLRYRLLSQLSWIVYVLLSPVRAFQRFIGMCFRLLIEWWHTRELRDLLYGTPAMLMMIGAGAVIASGLMSDGSRVRQQYLAAADDAFASEKYATARLLYQRAVQEGETNGEVLFRLARCCEELKDIPAMEAIVDQLAPLNSSQKSIYLPYAPAHLRQAVKLLQIRPVQEENITHAESHLLKVIQLDRGNENANRLLGEMYFQQEKWLKAIEHLKAVVEQRPEYNMTICRAYGKLDDSRAIGYAEQGRNAFLKRIDLDPKAAENYSYAGDACMLLGDYQQAANYMTRGLEVQPDSPLLQYGLGRAYVQWGMSLRGETRQERAVQLELFSKALTINPNEFLVYDGLVNILRAKDETSLQAEEFLTAHMAEGKSIGLCHMLLASLAEARGDQRQCELHLSRAFDLMPHAAVIANNLAWILAMKDDPEPERALVLINRVIDQAPDVKRFLDTRGQIHTLLGNWEEAVADLERTMPEFSNNSKTHEALARCYEQLGDQLLAEQHRRLAHPGQRAGSAASPPSAESKDILSSPPPAEPNDTPVPAEPETPDGPRI